MTKAELVKKLEKYPDDMEVFIDERYTDFRFGAINTVSTATVEFAEEPCGEVLSEEECIIISEE